MKKIIYSGTALIISFLSVIPSVAFAEKLYLNCYMANLVIDVVKNTVYDEGHDPVFYKISDVHIDKEKINYVVTSSDAVSSYSISRIDGTVIWRIKFLSGILRNMPSSSETLKEPCKKVKPEKTPKALF